MLIFLNVLNGVMTPKFDQYNNTYSVTIEENVTELMLEYKANPEYYVKVIGNNNLINGDNIVTIEVIGSENTTIYTLLVYKEYTETVFNYKELTIEAEKEELPEYVAPLIASICLIVIIIIALLLFKRKKAKNIS